MKYTETILRKDVENFNDYHGIELDLLEVQIPEETNHYKPISFKELIDTSMEMCDKNGLNVVSRRYTTNGKKNEVIAYYGIEGHEDFMGHQLAWRNSYNKSMSVAFVSGSEVWICGNSCVKGDMTFKKKHIGTIKEELQETIKIQIDGLGDTYESIIRDFQTMKLRELTVSEMSALCGRMYIEERLLTVNELTTVKDEILKPTFNYSHDGYQWGNNDLYSLYHHCTYALKDSHPYKSANAHKDLHQFFLKVSNR